MRVRSLAQICTVLAQLMGAVLPAAAQQPQPAQQQQPVPAVQTVQVIRNAVILEQPRGDSIRVATAVAGDRLEVQSRSGQWFLVTPLTSDTTAEWRRGWIHVSSIEPPVGLESAERPRPRGRWMARAFAQTGGTLFSAGDSFETIAGSAFGGVTGGGAQIVFPNAAFVQVSFETFEETGTRALVSGDRIFTLDTPATIAIRPVMATVGYRAPNYGRWAPYFGVGLGWHVLTEKSPTVGVDERESSVGYHVAFGTEYSLARVLAVAGEVQWATVPKILGESGVSALFGEDDLGGATFRVKVIIGY